MSNYDHISAEDAKSLPLDIYILWLGRDFCSVEEYYAAQRVVELKSVIVELKAIYGNSDQEIWDKVESLLVGHRKEII